LSRQYIKNETHTLGTNCKEQTQVLSNAKVLTSCSSMPNKSVSFP